MGFGVSEHGFRGSEVEYLGLSGLEALGFWVRVEGYMQAISGARSC